MTTEQVLKDGSGNHARFPTTRWSLVVRAGGLPDADAGPDALAAIEAARQEALAAILRRYLPALRAHLSAKSVGRDRAEDLLQQFVADRVIERNLLAHADQGRGRFRAFLVTALNNFASNQLRFDTAGRRAPKGAKVLALGAGPAGGGGDTHDGPGLDVAAPDDDRTDAFDVAWAKEVLAEGLRRMRDECLGCGRADLWEVFELRVLSPALDDAEPLGYGEMVRRFGYATPKQAANALVTAKRRFEAALRSVLAEYVADEAEMERELASLGSILSSPGARAAGVAEPGGGGTVLRQAAGRCPPAADVAGTG